MFANSVYYGFTVQPHICLLWGWPRQAAVTNQVWLCNKYVSQGDYKMNTVCGVWVSLELLNTVSSVSYDKSGITGEK